MTKRIIILTISIILCLSIVALPVTGGFTNHTYQAKEVIQAAVLLFNETGPVEQLEKVVLLEMFTATWCVFCAVAESVVDELSGEYGSRLAILEYHPYPDTTGDIFGIPEGSQRMSEYYGAETFPTVVFDGVIKKVGSDNLEENLYTTYNNYINARLDLESPIMIKINGTIAGTTGHVEANFETQGYFSTALDARIMVFEDNIYFNYSGSNGITNHRFVVREILEEREITLNRSTNASLAKDFSVGANWNFSNIGIVAFIQSNNGVLYASHLGDLSQFNNEFWLWVLIPLVPMVLALILGIGIKIKRKDSSSDSKKDNP